MIFVGQEGFYTINPNFPSDSSGDHEVIRGVELYDADGVGAGSVRARRNNSGETEFPVASSSFFFDVLLSLFFLYVWVLHFWALRIESRWEVFHFPFIRSDGGGGIFCLLDQWKGGEVIEKIDISSGWEAKAMVDGFVPQFENWIMWTDAAFRLCITWSKASLLSHHLLLYLWDTYYHEFLHIQWDI